MVSTFTLGACLNPQHVVDLHATDKAGALNELIDLIGDAPQIADLEAFRKAIEEREQVMSTGIGLGLALPHVKIPEVVGIITALGRSLKGIDFDALDGRPVHLILMIAAPLKQHRDFLKVIAHVSKLLKDENLRNDLLACPTPFALYGRLLAAEKALLAE